MSKAVLISIRPKWCEKIVSGEKTIEVRKTKPKIDGKFKCYIYCAKPSKAHQTICGCMVINTDELFRLPNGKIKHDTSIELMSDGGEYSSDNFLNGKVIGEFVCDDTKEIILQALQEKLEREKGCEYCKGFYLENASGRKFYKAFPHTSNYWTTLDDVTVGMVHDKDGYFLHFENESGERMFDVKISDCPMCGRKLGE